MIYLMCQWFQRPGWWMFSFLIYSPFNLVPNSISSLSPFYLSPWPPPLAVVSTVWSFWVLSLYSSINLSFWLSLPSLKVVARGYFILTSFIFGITPHPSICPPVNLPLLWAYSDLFTTLPPSLLHQCFIHSSSPLIVRHWYSHSTIFIIHL